MINGGVESFYRKKKRGKKEEERERGRTDKEKKILDTYRGVG